MPLVFGSDKNAMLIREDFLAVRLPASNPYLSRVLSKHAEALLQRLDNSKTIRGRVESLLTPGLHTGDVGMEAITGKMGLSRQTLFRKLKAEGVTFADRLLRACRIFPRFQALDGIEPPYGAGFDF